MLILALSCAALAAGQGSNTNVKGPFWPTHPRIAGIRVGPHADVSGPGPNYPSADGYCSMDILADEHTTVFAPGTLPGQTNYLFYVTSAPTENTVTDIPNKFRGQTSGLLVLSSSGPLGGAVVGRFRPGLRPISE